MKACLQFGLPRFDPCEIGESFEGLSVLIVTLTILASVIIVAYLD